MKTLTVSGFLRMPFGEIKDMRPFLVRNAKTKKVLFKIKPIEKDELRKHEVKTSK